jgi:hypothetical protein
MKKKRIIIWSIITLLTIVAVLEIFDLHPSLQVGSWNFYWSGVSHMAFYSSPMTASGGFIQGQWHIYGLGPIFVLRPA